MFGLPFLILGIGIGMGVQFGVLPPCLYQYLISERAIQTFKAHLIAGLSSCDSNLSLHLWDRLIRQAELTLTLMIPTCVNPCLSAEEYLNGDFYFNHTPLAPPGTRVLIFEVPTKRCMFAQHGVEGCYLGPAPEQYLYYTVYVPDTRAKRIVNTVHFSRITYHSQNVCLLIRSANLQKNWRRHLTIQR